MFERNITRDVAIEVLNMNKTIERQEIIIDELILKAAKYKAYFYNKHELAEKLEKQIMENMNNCIGEFDGFCYASWRAKAVYRTLEDMFVEGLITAEEYRFCEV